jgi:hypothetical protein
MTFPWLVLAILPIAGAATIFAYSTRQFLIAGLAGAAGILIVHGLIYFDYTSDDAYISYRYARNLSEGQGLVWNPGERVEGYSNFLWVMVLAGFDRIGADIVTTGRWLGFAFGLATIAGAYRLSRDLLDGVPGRAAGFATAILLACCATFVLWTFAGLESSLFAALVMGGVLLHIREARGMRPPLSSAAWALAAMTRPEGPLFFAVSGVFKLGEAIAHVAGAPSGEKRSTFLREAGWLLLWAAIFAVIYGAYFAWRYTTYDYFFPNTYYAKVGDGMDQYDRGLDHVSAFMREYSVWLLALTPVALALTSMRRAPTFYVFTMLLAYAGYVVYVGGDSLLRFRFFAPMMPLIYVLITTAAAALIANVRVERDASHRTILGGIALGGAALLLFTLQASTNGLGAIGSLAERNAVEDRVEIGRWLRANVPDDTVIAVVPAGAIPYESRLETIDMLGINNEHIAHRDVTIGAFAAGHEKYDTQYVLDQQPDIIILFDGLWVVPAQRQNYNNLARGIIPALIDMVNTPRLWEEYEMRSVEIREGAWFNLLVRRGASDVLPQARR